MTCENAPIYEFLRIAQLKVPTRQAKKETEVKYVRISFTKKKGMGSICIRIDVPATIKESALLMSQQSACENMDLLVLSGFKTITDTLVKINPANIKEVNGNLFRAYGQWLCPLEKNHDEVTIETSMPQDFDPIHFLELFCRYSLANLISFHDEILINGEPANRYVNRNAVM